ncbi:hypothetical protein [Asticcacaulis sp. 201]|uniref:hypothetical protein n=1 Tax=Asticcacaulis sp. 201 TaxID=3028787 RepID=UPI0029163282|nr:hypothetical protein [Asticcacaulis sp. 201]MDV6329858.1 hypothetical protein [Asticcacaulis sp. 201]
MIGAYSYTIVQPAIPLEAVTPLERLVLGEVMDSRTRRKRLHLCAYDDLTTRFDLFLKDAVGALDASRGRDSVLNGVVARLIAAAPADADSIRLDLDAEAVSLAHILQDIVRRSATLTHLVVTSGYTRSGLDTGTAGGAVSVITTYDVEHKSTDEWIEDYLDDAGLLPDRSGDIARFGPHTARLY